MSGTTQTTRSIFGVDPVDEFAVQVSEWIWQHGQGLLNLEIEAKIGLLIDRKTNARLQLPIHCETSTCLMP